MSAREYTEVQVNALVSETFVSGWLHCRDMMVDTLRGVASARLPETTTVADVLAALRDMSVNLDSMDPPNVASVRMPDDASDLTEGGAS